MRPARIAAFVGAFALFPVAFSTTVRAHCPLCSAGAGGAAALASALGIGLGVVGVFVGAFGIATGLWTASYVDGEYVPHQDRLLALGTFLAVVLPVVPLMNETVPVFLSIAGEYGTPLNRTYLIDTYLVGTAAGGGITYVTPRISARISELRGTTVPFQGLALTFGLLGASAALLEVLL